MQAILDMFDERVQEIDLYFEAIKELDRGSIGHATDTHYFNEEFIKIWLCHNKWLIFDEK